MHVLAAYSAKIRDMTLRPNLNSITTRLILFGLAIVIASSLARVFVLSNYLRKDLTEQSTAQLLTLANYVARDIDHNVVERRELLQRIGSQLPFALLRDPHRLHAWLDERNEISPLFSVGLSILDTSGIALAGYASTNDSGGASFAERDYFKQAMKGQFAIGQAAIGRVSKVPVLPMAMPLKDSVGKVRAVLVGVTALDAPGFLDGLQKTRVGTTGGLELVSPGDRLFIAASDMNIALKPVAEEGVLKLHDQAMQGFRGAGIEVNGRGIEELTAIATVASSGWFVVAHLQTVEAFAPVTRLQNFMLSNAAGVTLIFLLTMVIFLRYLLRPLKNAAQYADRMTRGEIPLEPLPLVRDDEVGHLTLAFNRVLSKLLESRAALEHLAHHDTLTGLPNRQLLADRMKQALARAQRGQRLVAVMLLDLDGFKPINDGMGHEAGDAALCEVAARLRGVLRREDSLARVGGDEFVILLSDLKDNAREAAQAVANKCLEVFQQPFIINEQLCRLGASIGIAIGDGECSPGKLLIAADQAMYQAKEAGRGQFRWSEECVLCSSGDKDSPCSVHSFSKKSARH
jgi:diguanylate cyclase (GGDEF)-like protein